MAIRVELRENDSVEYALRKLKRICSREGRPRGRKAMRFYEKPSERRRRKMKERMKVIKRAERMREMS